jgi:hypothetical protein
MLSTLADAASGQRMEGISANFASFKHHIPENAIDRPDFFKICDTST